MNSDLDDWPTRWHSIISEYNLSYERAQYKLRLSAEKRFDRIRRENDLLLCDVRRSRDECAERTCELIDSKSEV
jgi:hypothetical protein